MKFEEYYKLKNLDASGDAHLAYFHLTDDEFNAAEGHENHWLNLAAFYKVKGRECPENASDLFKQKIKEAEEKILDGSEEDFKSVEPVVSKESFGDKLKNIMPKKKEKAKPEVDPNERDFREVKPEEETTETVKEEEKNEIVVVAEVIDKDGNVVTETSVSNNKESEGVKTEEKSSESNNDNHNKELITEMLKDLKEEKSKEPKPILNFNKMDVPLSAEIPMNKDNVDAAKNEGIALDYLNPLKPQGTKLTLKTLINGMIDVTLQSEVDGRVLRSYMVDPNVLTGTGFFFIDTMPIHMSKENEEIIQRVFLGYPMTQEEWNRPECSGKLFVNGNLYRNFDMPQKFANISVQEYRELENKLSSILNYLNSTGQVARFRIDRYRSHKKFNLVSDNKVRMIYSEDCPVISGTRIQVNGYNITITTADGETTSVKLNQQ